MQNSEENNSVAIDVIVDETQVVIPNYSEENINDIYCGLDIDSHFLIFVTIFTFMVILLSVTS